MTLDALYYVSLFDEDKLAKIDDYDATLIKKNFPTAEDFKSKGKTIPPIDIEEQFQRSEGLEAFFYWAFVEQGGEILLQKMINEAVQKSKTVLADEAKGINFFMQATVRQTVRSTVINANQLIFKDDGPLQTACANIRKSDQEINDFTSAFKIEITSNAKPSDFGSDMNNPKAPGWALDLDQGQARALSQLIFNREKWRIIAKEAFLEAIVRALEIRDRAEKDVNANKRDELYKKLTDLFKDLDILEVGNASFQYKGGYNIATRIWAETLQFKTRHERDVYEMKVLQAFLDAYSSVKQAREAIENAFRSNTEKDSAPRPLTSSLPLTGEPEKDAVLAQEFAQEMSTAAQRIRQVLEAIKKGTLDKDGYDQQMYSRIYEAHYLRTFFDIQRKAVRNMAKEIRFWQLVKIYDAETAYSESDKKGQEYKKLYDGLVEDFRKHYAETQISISISGPDKGEVDKEVKLEAVLKDNDNKTAEIPKDSKIEWISDEKIIFTGKTYTFVPDKPGVIEINLTLIKEADGKREIIAATKTPYRLEIASWKPTVTIKGPGEGEVGKEIGLFAEVLADDAMKKSLQLEWSVEGHKDLTGKGLTFKFTPKEAGIYKVKVEAYSVVDNREFKVAEDDHDIKVRGWKATIRITGDRQGEVGKPVTLSADVSTDETQRPLVRVEWVYTASGAPVGSGTQFQFTPDRAGVHTFKAILYLPAGGTEFPVATDTWPVTVQDRQGNVPTPCTYKYSDWGECQPNGTQSRAVLSSDRFGCTETPITVRPCTYVPLHDKDRDTSTAQPDSQNIQVGEATVPPDDKKDGKPTTGDPKQQAEEKYRWLKESVAYLEALKEFDRKSYNSFEKSVTSSIVREFVSKAPPRYDKEFKLPDGPDKALCGETFGDIRDRLIGYESECWSTSNAGCKTVGTREFTRTVDGKEIKFAESISSCDIPCGKAQTCSNVLKTYSGQLGYANDLQDYINEKQLGCLGEAVAANGKHQRELDKKIKELPESLPYKRFQEFAGLSDWKGYLAAVEKTKQEFGLSDPIPSPIVLPWTYSSPCGGGAGPVADTSKLVVTLAARPEKSSYKPGDTVNVTAAVTGGKPPYTYTWTGDHAGDGQTVTSVATKPGSYALSVEVKDGTGARGATSITLKYEGVTAGIEGLTNQIIYGTSLKLRAKTSVVFGETPAPAASPKDKVDPEEEEACRVWKACLVKAKTNPGTVCSFGSRMDPDRCGDDTPAKPQETSAYRVIWQSDKTLEFDPGTSYDGTTIVLLDRMGAIKIWAEIEKKTGDKVYERVGETDQREVTVIPPKFKMTFVPEKGKGKVGQEVRVTIETDPEDKARDHQLRMELA